MTDQPKITAYCAPGRRTISEIALVLTGERVDEVVEHPIMDGKTDVLVAETPAFVAPPLFDLTPPPSVMDRLGLLGPLGPPAVHPVALLRGIG